MLKATLNTYLGYPIKVKKVLYITMLNEVNK